MTDVRVLTLGESLTEATVATWFKQPGDSINIDEMLCELETDKVTVEVPSPVAGIMGEIIAQEGTVVSMDALLTTIGEGTTKKSNDEAKDTSKKENEVGTISRTEINVPTLGESIAEATVATWFKSVGDEVKQDEMVCELETDKVSVEVPSPVSGFLEEILVPEGDLVNAGGSLAIVAGSLPAKKKSVPADSSKSPAGEKKSDFENAPSAKKLMAEKGISADKISGSGRDGRIMKSDVEQMPNPASQEIKPNEPISRPPSSAEDADREERVKMTRLRQTIAKRLKDSQNTAAMLTTYNEVDMTEVMSLRSEFKDLFERKHRTKLGFMSFFTKACCHALKEVPEVNSEIDGTEIVYKNYVHMGIAAGTPTGLVVPVIRNADTMSFAEIEKSIAEKGKRARDGKLSMDEMQGGTFTISNGGVYGSLMSSPILNPPQSGILGMHKIQDRPVAVNGEVVIRPMMYLALSYDHRIVDGKGAVTFLVRVKEALEDPRRLLMDL
jgi:2-oxoglutarate dehydrogenase E2 component (dihydrolipoamide succinyltransferase)